MLRNWNLAVKRYVTIAPLYVKDTMSIDIQDAHSGFLLLDRGSCELFYMVIDHFAAVMAECEMHIAYWCEF